VNAREEELRRKQVCHLHKTHAPHAPHTHLTHSRQKHIRLLHDYNETRDAAQVLFGQLATLDGLTIQDLYGRTTTEQCERVCLTKQSVERFGVSLDD
jgi:hypothetical protein